MLDSVREVSVRYDSIPPIIRPNLLALSLSDNNAGTWGPVSLYSTVQGAIQAITESLKKDKSITDNLDLTGKKVTLYQYEPILLPETRIVTSELLLHHKLVTNAHLTKEVVIVDPVEVKLKRVIEVEFIKRYTHDTNEFGDGNHGDFTIISTTIIT